MPSTTSHFATLMLLFAATAITWFAVAAPARAVEADVRPHLGRPTLFVDGKPLTLAAYSPAGFSNRKAFQQELSHFLAQPLNAYFLCIGSAKEPPDEPGDFWATPFWRGDTISPEPLTEFNLPPDEQAETILDRAPKSLFIVRFSAREPESWRRLHPEQSVVTDAGETLPHASLASDLFWDDCGRCAAAAIEYSEGRPWARSRS